MGKNLKGKECGKGIYQRKDGLYHARFVDKAGKRHEKYFQTIPETNCQGLFHQIHKKSTKKVPEAPYGF